MKFLIVDDSVPFVIGAVDSLRREGFQAAGLIPQLPDMYGTPQTRSDAIRDADVIFLDHNLPGESGEQWLLNWAKTTDFSRKKVIGTSDHFQSYVSESVKGDIRVIVEKVKRISGGEVAS